MAHVMCTASPWSFQKCSPIAFAILVALCLAGCGEPTTYEVQHEDVTVGGYVCQSLTYQYQTARVYYPSAGRWAFPLISFAHGFNNPGVLSYACYEELLVALAGQGYVVIALESSAWPQECPEESLDQLRSIVWAQTSDFADMIDFSKVGLMGHSMGGAASYHNAGQSSVVSAYNIGAAVALHPQTNLFPDSSSLVPIFFGCGSADRVVDADKVKALYSGTSGVPKAFFEIDGAVHDEPMCDCDDWETPGLQRDTPYAIAMFDCHLKADASQCDKIYGSGSDSLCGGSVVTTDCLHENGPTSEAVTV